MPINTGTIIPHDSRILNLHLRILDNVFQRKKEPRWTAPILIPIIYRILSNYTDLHLLFWHLSQLSQQYYFNTCYSIKRTNTNLLFIIFYFIFCIIRIFQEHLQVFEPLRKYLLEHYNFHQ